MDHITPMNSKESKRLIEQLNEMFDAGLNHHTFPYFLLKSSSGKVYIVNKEYAGIPTERLRINNAGLYFCDVESGIRLSIEGSQIIGKTAQKHILEMGKEEIQGWLVGNDVNIRKEAEDGTYLIRYGNDFYGCGILKGSKLMNFVPKMRRLNNVEQV